MSGLRGLLLAGSARDALEAQEKAQALVREQEIEGKKRELERKRQAMEAQIAVLRAEFEVEQAEAAKTIGQDQTRAGVLAGDRVQMARLRQSDAGAARKTTKTQVRRFTMKATKQQARRQPLSNHRPSQAGRGMSCVCMWRA